MFFLLQKEFKNVDKVLTGDFFFNGLEQLYILHHPTTTTNEKETRQSQKTLEGKRKRQQQSNSKPEETKENAPFTLTDLNALITSLQKETNKEKSNKENGNNNKSKRRKIQRFVAMKSDVNNSSASSLQHVAYSLYSQLMGQKKAQQAAHTKVLLVIFVPFCLCFVSFFLSLFCCFLLSLLICLLVGLFVCLLCLFYVCLSFDFVFVQFVNRNIYFSWVKKRLLFNKAVSHYYLWVTLRKRWLPTRFFYETCGHSMTCCY